eukprot:CAMPEP_0170278504 /NCGR_PEP_ID=MMETSP0116_2-20130129/39256_1 /TAXON_ID=400756 /ORGANISM="Durinskia baltica, Strain CSIRO CS-38" /LENGTH=51 /DNA_ID=CAMNT_0010529815 /DNA_START=84 /DNA_END=239 /DNA_ORIENTATION=-
MARHAGASTIFGMPARCAHNAVEPSIGGTGTSAGKASPETTSHAPTPLLSM